MAQERNYETKNPKKTGGSKRTFAQKEAVDKEGAASKPYYGKEGQERNLPIRIKTLLLCSPVR